MQRSEGAAWLGVRIADEWLDGEGRSRPRRTREEDPGQGTRRQKCRWRHWCQIRVVVRRDNFRGGTLVPLPSSQEGTVVEHVLRHRVQCPVVAFAGISWLARNFYEAVVEWEVVSDGVLPGRELLPIVRETSHDKLADATERELLVRRLENGHCDEGYVRVRWFDQTRLLSLHFFFFGRALFPQVQRRLCQVHPDSRGMRLTRWLKRGAVLWAGLSLIGPPLLLPIPTPP